jgi:oligoendopeptidase F
VKKAPPAPRSSATGVRWDLADLYSSPVDPAIDKDLKQALKLAKAFEKTYKGRFAQKGAVGADELAGMVQDLEKILIRRDKPSIYASLLFSGDTQNAEFGRLMQETQDRATAVHQHLVFWELEWCALDETVARKLIEDPACARFKNFLTASRRYRPHLLSESEEKIIDELDNTGSRAFSRLFDEFIGGMQFEVTLKGKPRSMSEQEALALLYTPERDTRKAAAEALTNGFTTNLRTLTFIFNTLVQNHAVSDRLRKYSGPMASRHLANEIAPKTVEALLKTCEANTHLVARYYKLKARLLGVKTLYDYDRYAPVSSALPTFDWKACRQTVSKAYADFSPECGAIVAEFFDKRWIDAELRPGKRGGAFSCGGTPDTHPYILANYTDNLRDAVTIAHELGHGIHQYLARKQGYLQADTPLTLAETASVFGEMLTFHSIMDQQQDPAARLSLLCGKIEDAFATVFRQACMTRFEQELHERRRKEGELPAPVIGEIWYRVNQGMFGDSVKLTEGYKVWWCYISHFIHSPFYCYAYSFGELLVLSLYSLYRQEGKRFVPKYLGMLSAGGSASPEELTRNMGLDITRPTFWNEGMAVIADMITQAETLARALPTGKPKK